MQTFFNPYFMNEILPLWISFVIGLVILWRVTSR